MTALSLGPLLAIETATRTARVAMISHTGELLAQAEHTADRHSAFLLGMCDELFRATQTTPAQLTAIACTAGPGSFTGLRVGMAVAKGLALPFGTPMVLVSSLQSLAFDISQLPEAVKVAQFIPCIDAGKGEIHGQEFSRQGQDVICAGDPFRLRPEDLCERLRLRASVPLVVGGPELVKFPLLHPLASFDRLLFCPTVPGPSAVSLAHLALAAFVRGETTDLGTAAPTYGRGPDITTPKRKTVGDATRP